MEIWERLLTGESLEGLYPTVEGKIDLRGLHAPTPSSIRHFNFHKRDVNALEGVLELRGVHWKGINFSRNSYHSVDFTKADLRQTVYVSADMIDCVFAETNLAKVDFQGTIFKNCIFSGLLNEVMFYRSAFRGERFPPNEMKGVDFRGAVFRHVEFRNLDMNDVEWPKSDQHIVLDHYKACLEKMLKALSDRPDVGSKKLQAILKTKLKWAGPNQRVGVLSKPDLLEHGSPEAITWLLSIE